MLIRRPDLVDRAVLAAANPGGTRGVPADPEVERTLNDPNVSLDRKLALTFPPGPEGERAAKEVYARIQDAGKRGTVPDDFTVSKETTLRQDRARTTLWDADEANFSDLKTIKTPVLVTDGRYDVDRQAGELADHRRPDSLRLARLLRRRARVPLQEHERFAQTLDAFLK